LWEARLPLESVLSGLGIAAEAALILLLIRVRAFRALPAFFIYICWSLLSDLVLWKLQTLPTSAYYRVYEAQMAVDTAMMFAVLVELAWSVLLPLRSSLPKHAWVGIAVLIFVAGAVVWPIAGVALPTHFNAEGQFFVRLQQVPAILRVVFFFTMAGFSQVIGIGWRNRELQIATGFGFYSILSLAVTVLHTHQMVGPQYHWLDELGAAGYLCALTYWVYAFATKEAERQNFSPQMANFLLLIGGTAKASRVALADFSVPKSRFKDR
jgi:hypothetical protein